MPFTIDVHHHIPPDFFWRETNDAHNPVGGIAPPPYLRRDLAVNCVQRLEQTAELTADERTRVMSGNAMKLFPRFGR